MNGYLEKHVRMNLAAFGMSAMGRKLLRGNAGNTHIASLLQSGQPFMVSRLGMVEWECVLHYCYHRKSGMPYTDRIRRVLPNNAGFFPPTDDMLDRFSILYLETIKKVDALGIYNFAPHEYIIGPQFCPNAQLMDWRSLEPFYHTNPWSAELAGKKVIVVYPFSKSIEKQYHQARTNLFRDKSVLPEFELRTVPTVVSLAGNPTNFKDWFAALEYMQQDISRSPFDIAIIGAGAYGMPLAAYVKSLGKQAIHIGGATQLLFGIKGKRWDDYKPAARYYNQY